jgi:hypothetical protein
VAGRRSCRTREAAGIRHGHAHPAGFSLARWPPAEDEASATAAESGSALDPPPHAQPRQNSCGHLARNAKSEKSPDVWVTVPDAWEPILDRETFRRVAAALIARAPTEENPKQPSADHLLTGILVCGACGAAYTIERAQVKEGPISTTIAGDTKEGMAAARDPALGRHEPARRPGSSPGLDDRR